MLDREQFVRFLIEEAGRPLTARQLIERLQIPPDLEREFLDLLERCTTEGDAVEIKGGKYAHPSRVDLAVGRVHVHPDGFGFVIPDAGEQPDLYIKPRWLQDVMHGDRVVARVERRGKKPEGRVIRILQRANSRVVGRVRVRKKFSGVVPLDEHLLHDIYVARDDLSGATDGQLVQVELTAYPAEGGAPEGRVVHVLGHAGDTETEAKAVALKHGVFIDFPQDALDEAEGIPTKVRKADLKGREDLRHLPFVTVDGELARDFDDAICAEALEDGSTRLWVAIADVGHYVRVGSALDRAAYERGTSTYFPGQVFPMLPERLSNGICSLNPGVERLVMVAELVLSRGGRRQSSRFYSGLICSRHRLTYTAVGELLNDPDAPTPKDLADVLPMLLQMGALARVIRARRAERGSIDFDLPEAEIVLDTQGRPEDIVKSERNWAHFMIEEFMIAANEAVAEQLSDRKIPIPYRVHDEPDPEKVADFRRFVHNFGYTLKGRTRLHPKDFQDLSLSVAGKPEERMIRHVMLRSMRKAVYSSDNIGHFGLASEFYAHFTSPIRRYPDLILHRHLKKALQKRSPSGKWRQAAQEELAEACPHLSERERRSEKAEREAVAWKKCQFMSDKIGSVHWGFITGVASFGVFVELEGFFVEGLVHVSSLQDDFYHYSEELQRLIGERTQRTFRIGDRIRVRVDRVNIERRQIDFALLEEGPRKNP